MNTFKKTLFATAAAALAATVLTSTQASAWYNGGYTSYDYTPSYSYAPSYGAYAYNSYGNGGYYGGYHNYGYGYHSHYYGYHGY